jgi:hypothetical protein
VSVVQPKTLMRPPVMTMASSMSHMVAFADAIPILSTLSAKSLRHKVQLVLPLTQFVATVSRHLSWSHFVNLLPLKRLDKHERQAGEEAPIGLILRARVLAQRKLPVENRLGSGDFDPTSNKIKVMTMQVSKGLEFPVVALPGVGHIPAAREDEKEAARVFYVAATRATQQLIVGVGGGAGLGKRLIQPSPPQY